MNAGKHIHPLVLLCFVGGLGFHAASAQTPWDTFQDSVSDSVCDIVNAANAEMVVLSATGQLVIVTGRDTVLADTLVTAEGDVMLGNEPVGFIGFEEDGDGFRTLWWTSLTGRVVNVDGFTGEPTETNMVPGDFVGVPCDVCERGLWDEPADCTIDPPLPPITIRLCGGDVVIAMMMSLGGLMTMGPWRRRSLLPGAQPKDALVIRTFEFSDG